MCEIILMAQQNYERIYQEEKKNAKCFMIL